MLDLFFTTASILICLKVFFILFESSNVAVSSANILSICFLYSSTDPGKMQHILSLSCFWVERVVGHTEDILCLLFDTEIEYELLLFAIPLEMAPSRQTMSSIEVTPSSSETTSVVSSGTPEVASFIIPSAMLVRRVSAWVSRIPWK